ncbi:MAG: VTT domain-containing protein [Candidatus Sungbacteria bacterium]|nr:VTT domain-containing protein [Candidatus Sungbacteria bacterium]
MESLLHIDLVSFAKTVGIIGIFLVTFAESGLFIGFFLPGDSLLFTAGFLASQGFFSIGLLMPLCFFAAVLGDSVGYSFGRRVGKKMFTKEDSLLFRKNHLHRASEFYERHGGKTIILARFMPIVRTFAPIVAGTAQMRYASFLFYNIIGGLLWAVGLTGLGYFLGSAIPDVDRYLLPIIGAIIFVSITPPALHMWKQRRRKTV